MSRTGKAFLYLVYFAIVAVLSGFIITSSKSNAPAAPKSPSHSQHRPQTAAAPPKTTAPAKPKPPAGTPASGSTPAPNPAPSGSSAALADTGPGDLIGLFVIASLAGAVFHRRSLINRAN